MCRGYCGVCGKANHASKKLARAEIRRLLDRGAQRTNRLGNPLRVYLACDQNSFHVGHKARLGMPNLNEPSLRWIEG